MSRHSRRQIGKHVFYAVAAGTLAVDQLSKLAARSALGFGRRVDVIPGLFSLRLVENPGAAFGMLGSWPPLLILIGFAAVLAVFALRRERSRSPVMALSLGFLLGGALGNLVDRIIFGPVTDFLDFGVSIGGKEYAWPTFNIADVAIVAGVVLLIYHTLFVDRDVPEKAKPEPGA